MSSPVDQARNRLVKKAKSNFWVWLDNFWAETPQDRSDLYMMVAGARPGMKEALVSKWKDWVKNKAEAYIKR